MDPDCQQFDFQVIQTDYDYSAAGQLRISLYGCTHQRNIRNPISGQLILHLQVIKPMAEPLSIARQQDDFVWLCQLLSILLPSQTIPPYDGTEKDPDKLMIKTKLFIKDLMANETVLNLNIVQEFVSPQFYERKKGMQEQVKSYKTSLEKGFLEGTIASFFKKNLMAQLQELLVQGELKTAKEIESKLQLTRTLIKNKEEFFNSLEMIDFDLSSSSLSIETKSALNSLSQKTKCRKKILSQLHKIEVDVISEGEYIWQMLLKDLGKGIESRDLLLLIEKKPELDSYLRGRALQLKQLFEQKKESWIQKAQYHQKNLQKVFNEQLQNLNQTFKQLWKSL